MTTTFTKERLTSAVYNEVLGYYVQPIKTVRPMIQFTTEQPTPKKFSMPGDGVI